MSEPVHCDPNEPFDPAVNYLPCCHPRLQDPETVARQTFEAWAAEQERLLNEWRAGQAGQNTPPEAE